MGFELNYLFWEPQTADVLDISIEMQDLFLERLFLMQPNQLDTTTERDEEIATLFGNLRLDSVSPAKNHGPTKEQSDRVKRALFF